MTNSSNSIPNVVWGRLRASGYCLVLFLCVMFVLGVGAPKALQETVPDFQLPTIDGTTYKIKDVLGKKNIVLNFWATWCVPCRREMLHLQKLYEQFQARGLEVVAISIDDASRLSQVKPYVKRSQYTYPVLLDTDSLIIKKFQAQPEVPLTVLVDKRGRIVRRFQGYKPGDEETLKADVQKLMDAR